MSLVKFTNNNIFKNLTSLSSSHGVQVLIQLLFVPIYLTFWNINTYSEWILISTIPALLSISQFGLTTYGSNLIVILSKQNSKIKANFALQNILYFTSLFVFLTGLIILILNFLINFIKIFNITSVNESQFFLILIFVFLKYLLLQISSFLVGLYRINHKFHISVYLKTFFVVTEIVFISLILVFGGEIFEVSLVSLLNYIIALFVIFILIKKEHKWLKIINFKNIDFLFIKKIFYPSISFLTGTINKALIAQGTIIFLNYFSNDMLIIFYNSLRLIINGARHFINIISTSYQPEITINGARHFINIISTSYQPEITINYAKKKINKISHQFKSLFKYNFYFSTIIFFIIILFIKEPFLIWTKYEIQWDSTFFLFFIFANYIEWLGIPIFIIPASINKMEMFNVFFIIILILYFITIAFLYPSQQILAIPIALLFANLYSLIHSWFILNKKIHRNLIKSR